MDDETLNPKPQTLNSRTPSLEDPITNSAGPASQGVAELETLEAIAALRLLATRFRVLGF